MSQPLTTQGIMAFPWSTGPMSSGDAVYANSIDYTCGYGDCEDQNHGIIPQLIFPLRSRYSLLVLTVGPRDTTYEQSSGYIDVDIDDTLVAEYEVSPTSKPQTFRIPVTGAKSVSFCAWVPDKDASPQPLLNVMWGSPTLYK